MKRLLLLCLAAFLALAGCLGELAGRLRGDAELAGRVFPEDAPPPDQLPEGSLAVVEHAPTGEVPWENLEGGVWVLFNKPVVALGRLPKPAGSSEVLRLRPALPGVFRWYGSRLLAFEPESAPAPATEYTVLVDPKLRAQDGSTLAGMDAFRFRTPPLKLLSLEPSGADVEPERCRTLELGFNYPVEPDSIRAALQVRADGRSWPFELRRPKPGERGQAEGRGEPEGRERRVLQLEMKRELPWDADVTVRLAAGARPGPGAYGTAEEQSLGFHTLEPLRAENAELYDWLAAVEASLQFNHPLRADGALDFLRVELPGYRLEENAEVTGNSIALSNLPVAFESTFTVTVRAGLSDLYGQKLPADRSFTLKVGPAASYVNYRAAGDRILEKSFPPLAVVEFQNALSGAWAAGRLERPFQPIPEVPLASYGELPRNTRAFRAVDLGPFLSAAGTGSAFARWRFDVRSWWSEEVEPQTEDLRLQVTDLGLSLHLAHNRLLAWVASLASGQPLAGAEVSLRTPAGEWRVESTDARGLASFELRAGELGTTAASRREGLELEVRLGEDRLVYRPALSPSYTWNLEAAAKAAEPVPVTWLATDRGLYRPGESLSFLGIDRDQVLGRLEPHQGSWTVELWKGWSGENVAARTSGDLSSSGRFWGSLQLPASLEPDVYLLVYRRPESSHRQVTPVKIAFFRRVAFALELDLPAGPKYMGDNLEARFAGRYLAGGSLNRGRWNWWWARREIPYRPPDEAGLYEGFRFGARTGGGESYDRYYGEPYEGYYEDLGRAEGSLGGDGTVTARQKLAEGRPGRVYRYELNATIQDVDRQAVSKSASLPVFSSELLIGARLAASRDKPDPLYFVSTGVPFAAAVTALDPLGAPYAGTRELKGRLLRENWKMVREKGVGGRLDTRWEREEIEEKSFTVGLPGRRDGQGRQLAWQELTSAAVGLYYLELTGKDRQGREALTRLEFYSTGSANVLWRRWDENRIELVPDRPLYSPGDKARLLVKSPLERGRYLLTVEREGLEEERVVELQGSTDVVEVEIREAHVPVIYVSLSAVSGRTAPPPDSPDLPDLGKPRGCFGLQALAVDPAPRRIELELKPGAASYRPGEEAELTIRARWRGRPLAGAEVALVAADRGVLDLIDYHLPDPLETFYSHELYPDRVHHADSRELLLDPVVWKVRDLPGGDKEGEPEAADADYPVRRDFRALASFQPALVTGADGSVTARFRLPDSLTTFRATAVAVSEDRFGRGETELLVSNPLNVRAALPRLLRVGDEASAGVVATNLQGRPVEVTVRAESELLELRDKPEKSLTLRAGETRELAFRWSAPRAGKAALRFEVDSPVVRESLEAGLNVEAGWAEEAVTIVGMTEDVARESLAVPDRFLGLPEEGLEVTLDSTIASSLVEAIRFLEVYPYDCLEQRTSKLFAYVLYDWLTDARSTVQKELAALPAYQTADGGFTYWQDPSHRRSSYYVSARTAHLLALAGERGIPAPVGLDWEALLAYLSGGYAEAAPALKPYALYVLARCGRDVREEALRAAAQPERAGLGGRALLALTLERVGERAQAERLLAGLRDHLRVGTRSVTLAGPLDSWYYFGGELQTKALLLMLYRRLQPESQIVQMLADDLLAAQRRGAWLDTSTTGWVLQAFAEYLEGSGERDADFQARVRLGSVVLAEQAFHGLSRRPATRRMEPEALQDLARAEGGATSVLPLEIGKQGRGRLYYTASLRYGLEVASLEPRDEGIGLATVLLDQAGKEADSLRLGQVYRVKAVVYSGRDRDFLALRLPIPAGTEVIDGSLATSQRLPGAATEEQEASTEYDRYSSPPVQQVYDAEVRFFFDRFARGRQELSFLVRATTPGLFRTPPASAELMYEPEVFGRTAGRIVRIAP
jgi:uncharacterized protein YfaS (alpha-2-macroglobulin family)